MLTESTPGLLGRFTDSGSTKGWQRQMPRQPGKQGPEDMNEIAFRVLREAVGDAATPEHPAVAVTGRAGGAVGGKARAKKLSPGRRSEIARKAAQARWQRS